ncbi:Hypothetical protein PHPALM_18500 [Phytophthora palmivora]|uniref:Uncharacterized protein n=1 Tax=Phytophthora palmivora TaxID=4796 RepID=A0A2P4XJK3_9STRA|nr:Hypothetical protein PHPALM_18500 [Phytophthora palmivora]
MNTLGEIVASSIISELLPDQGEDDESHRTLRALQIAEEEPTVIFYPISASDQCDCIIVPDTESLEEVGVAKSYYWGTFQVESNYGNYYDISYDPADVYSQCEYSYAGFDQVSDIVICEYDLTDDTSAGTMESKKEIPSDQATTPSLRKEGTGGGKKTRIHLSVHRMLTTLIEAVFALQYPTV